MKRKGHLKSEPLPASWENWPTSGGMRNGQLFQRPTLEPATGARGGFAGHGGRWDTPDGMPEAPNTGSNRKAQVAGLGNQAQQVTTWATPQARDHKNPDKPESGNFQRKLQQGYTIDLNSQASNWPTPMASDEGHKVTINSNQAGLIGASHQFMERQFSPQAQPTPPGQASSSTGPTSPRRLNPAFTEWLMGWPTGWTIAAPQRLKCCGNGVVAAQAAFAFVGLVRRMNEVNT
jgi:hypothetical protein